MLRYIHKIMMGAFWAIFVGAPLLAAVLLVYQIIRDNGWPAVGVFAVAIVFTYGLMAATLRGD